MVIKHNLQQANRLTNRILLFFYCSLAITPTGFAQNKETILFIKNETSLNTKYLDYSPIFYQDQIVFTSTRPIAGSPMTLWRDEKKQFSNLYIADQSGNGGYFNIQRLPGKVSSKVHDGVASFNRKGTEMYFTRNNQKGKNEENVINLKIYNAELINGTWQNVQELPLNDETFSNCHPSLSIDGSELYFASNRPGGFGGMDLYVSKKVKGVWQSPTNLGASINSEANELFPHIATTGVLYFSSNCEKSIGGLDVFKAIPTVINELVYSVENLGEAFNSTNDDFGFCTNTTETEGFFSSNRKGGKGGDDIYFWQWQEKELPPNQMDVLVFDGLTNERISEATVTIFDGGVPSTKEDIYPIANMVRLSTHNPYSKLKNKQYKTGTRGKISLLTEPKKSYTIFVERKGYLPLKKVISKEELIAQKNWELLLERKAGIPLSVKAFEMPNRSKLPFIKLELFNHCTEETQMAISNQYGQYVFYLPCGCDYTLTGKKDTYRAYEKNFSTKYRDCGNLSSIKVDLYMVGHEVLAEITNKDNFRFPSFEAFEAQYSKKVGQIIVMDKLNYPENKADLLPEATQEIYKIHYLLQKNPNMSVEISTHTDAFGTAKFNHRLTQKRADAIYNFLIEKGIPKEQMSAVGYGEDKLLCQCADEYYCTQYAFHQNKRVEIKITEIRKVKSDYLIGQR